MIQRVSENVFTLNGETLPWFTFGCLQWLTNYDLSNKNILEFGSGNSTAWLSKRCNELVSIEANRTWYGKTSELTRHNKKTRVLLREVNEGDLSKVDYYCNAADDMGIDFDIVIVDGILRYECLLKGIILLSKKGGLIIADNWKQSYVWICPACEELMSKYDAQIYEQPDHTDNDGINKWKTAVFTIPKGETM